MTATLINGRAIAGEVLTGLAAQVSALGEPLHLAAVCVGDEPGLKTFVRIKQKAAHSIGAQFSSYMFDATDEEGVRTTLGYLASDDSVHGIFIELPLPSALDAAGLTALIPDTKDVDVLTASVRDAFYRNDASAIVPPAALALRYAVDAHAVQIAGARAAVIGAGELVGKPVAHWLRSHGAHVEVLDIDTPSPAERARSADIVVAATGVPGLVTGDWVRDGATVFDYGYGKKGSQYVGDVNMESVQKKAGLLSPVPGGMGPLVVAAVLENLVTLATR